MIPCPRFEIRRKRNVLGRWRYRVVLIAENCEPLNVSEHLNSEAAAYANIAAVQSVVPVADIYPVY